MLNSSWTAGSTLCAATGAVAEFPDNVTYPVVGRHLGCVLSGSYHAGAELVGNGGGIAAKYAGQTILVPSDQLVEAQQLHAEAIRDAYAQNEVAKAHSLESVRYDDHIHSGGVESQPLTYEGAQAGADGIRHGELPDYVGEDTGPFSTNGESAMLEASITLATIIGGQLVSDAAKVYGASLRRMRPLRGFSAALVMGWPLVVYSKPNFCKIFKNTASWTLPTGYPYRHPSSGIGPSIQQ